MAVSRIADGIELSLFGGFECRDLEGEAVVFPTRKVRALCAYLALHGGRPVRREKLAALLWGGQGDGQARANLRKALSRLRAGLSPSMRSTLVGGGATVCLRGNVLEVDALRFEQMVESGTPDSLERAATMYRGALLEGFEDCDEGFDDWLAGERSRFEELFVQVLQRLLEHYVITGAVDRGIRVAQRLLLLDPLHEAVHRTLMRLYLYQDRIGMALEQYRSLRARLEAELGAGPSAETERLREELLRRTPGECGTAEVETDDLPERAVVLESATAARERRRAELAASGRPSIAVLVFRCADDSAALGYLCEGFAEDIATELGRFPELAVIAPGSAQAFRALEIAPEAAGRELGAHYVVEGSLRPEGERLRITVRLVASADGRQVWAERYDCARAEVFEVQDDIVRRITGALAGRIEDRRLAVAARRPPADLGAYDFCLRGWSALRRPEPAAIAEARRCFREAIACDPHYGRSYVGLALAHLNEWTCFTWNHWVFPARDVQELARRAVELDDRDHRAHCVLAMVEIYSRDYAAAAARLDRALELNPNDADLLAHAALGFTLLGEHRRALDHGRRALRLAPHHPEWYTTFAGMAHFNARQYDEAIATMTPAPEAICNTPAFIAAAWAHLGETAQCQPHRDTVYRHYTRQRAAGAFPEDMSCIGWLLAIDPFRLDTDVEHYAEGLRRAGFS